MKKVLDVLKKAVFSIFLLYGFNLISVNFNVIVPINVINVSLVTFLGAPGLIALVLFKVIVM